jgi:antitoxin PrlF
MPLMEIEAAVTDRGQTTIPAAIRKLLRVDRRSSVVFRVTEDGSVTLTAKPTPSDEPDPVVTSFLTFLEADMAKHPDRLRPVTAEWLHELQDLVACVEVDLDAPLPDEPD